jgi:uncharacterized phage-associated protein
MPPSPLTGPMYDARAVANFFLDRAWHRSEPLTVLTLLKVLYFAHAWYLAEKEKALLAQPFEAWKYGPVCRVVYDQLKGMGKKPIEKKLVSFDMETHGFEPTTYSFPPELITFLADVFDYYSKFHPFTLSDLTHERDSPWEKVWSEAAERAVPGMIIPDSLIADWFRQTGGVLGRNGQFGPRT